MYEIVKRVDFSFGHRLVNYDGKCNRPHGHNGVAEVRLAADALDEAGMVADFGDVGDAVGGWIDDNLDHRMILRADDPLAPLNRGARRDGVSYGSGAYRGEHGENDLRQGCGNAAACSKRHPLGDVRLTRNLRPAKCWI